MKPTHLPKIMLAASLAVGCGDDGGEAQTGDTSDTGATSDTGDPPDTGDTSDAGDTVPRLRTNTSRAELALALLSREHPRRMKLEGSADLEDHPERCARPGRASAKLGHARSSTRSSTRSNRVV